MGDFSALPAVGSNRGILSPAGATPFGDFCDLTAQGYANTAAVWTANRAVYQPVLVEVPCTVFQIQVTVSTQAGNLDVGIYQMESLKRIVSKGSTAVAAAGFQALDITDTYLVPGWYFLAFCCDSSTAVFRNSGVAAAAARACGFAEQAVGAVTLPDPAVPAAYATACAPQIIASYSTII